MFSPARILFIIGVVCIAASLLVSLGGRLHLGRLPGDIIIRRENFTFYFPIVTAVLISIILSAVLRILRYFTR